MREKELLEDRFELSALAGSGGMGAVYRARDLASGGDVAVKILSKKSPESAERFVREAQALATLSHPSIVRFVAHGVTSGGELYLAMEWLEGEDLAERLSRGPLTLEESLSLAARAADALDAAHARGIIHRDIKPSNLFLPGGDIERLKILDFGIARVGAGHRGGEAGQPDSTRLNTSTAPGALVGTPGYMAPEQARGDRNIDARADIFALGCVLFECLTGRAAFVGAHPLAVLAKILLEPPPRLRDERLDIPRGVDSLVNRMLATDVAARPRDMAALRSELSTLRASEPHGSATIAPPSVAPPSLTAREQRSLCVVLAGLPRRADEEPEGATLEKPVLAPPPALATLVETNGGRIEVLADGSVVVTLAGARTAKDQVARAALCALAMREQLPSACLSVATGRGVFSGRWPVGEVIDRAARMLYRRAVAPGQIRIDQVTAGLLDARFDVSGDASGLLLKGEKESVERVRTLLGKPTPCVGREREIASLTSLFEQAMEEPVARAALVLGDLGIGKSRLAREALRRLRESGETFEVWTSRGDPMAAGSPFGMVAQALRRTAGILDGEPLAVRRRKLKARVARHVKAAEADRVAEFLGEVIGAPFQDTESVALRAARQDPMLMSDQIRRAFEDFLRAECSAVPVLLLLEDLHFGDLPSVRLLGAALRSASDLPWMILGLARSEVREQFPDLFREHEIEEIYLSRLTRRGSEKLVHAVLGEGADKHAVEQIVVRAEGNPLYLEELCRAVAEGNGDRLPETIVTMAQVRIEQLDPETRRVLRAASVFGQDFWTAGVRALLAGDALGQSLDAQLRDLLDREILVRHGESKFPGQEELSFRHAVLREASYKMCVAEDRALGHLLAGQWLEQAGESDPIVLAEHFERGGAPQTAVAWYLRAAEQALDGNDLAASIAHADRGLSCGASGETRGALLLLQEEAELWRGDNAAGAEKGVLAMACLPRGSPSFCRAAGQAAAAAARLGDADRMDAIGNELLSLANEDIAHGAYAIACSRTAMSRLLLGQRDKAEAFVRILDRLEPTLNGTDPVAFAWIRRVTALHAYLTGDLGGYLLESRIVAERFEEIGDIRISVLQRVNVGYAYLVLGDWAEAERTLREVIVRAEPLGLGIAIANARHNLGLALGRLGRFEEAIAVETEAEKACHAQGDRRLSAGSRLYLAHIRMLKGDLDGAEQDAHRAVEMAKELPAVKGHALAVLARVLLETGRSEEALRTAKNALELVSSGELEAGEALARLTFAEALHSQGQKDASLEAIREARDLLLISAMKIRHPELRRGFLHRIQEHSNILSRAAEWEGLRI